MGRKFALIIGSSEYKDRSLPKLTTPEADVRGLTELLLNEEIGGFDQVDSYINESFATLRMAVANFFADRSNDDLLLLYFSGHGVLDEQGRLYFAVKDTQRSRLSGAALSSRFITEEMDSSRSKRQILILDCCYSGAVVRGVKGEIGAKAITGSTFDGSNFAKIIITATDATQYAWEGNHIIGDLETSLFTSFLIDGFKTGVADLNGDGRITVEELYSYVYERMLEVNSIQKPRKWVYNQEGDHLVIAANPFLESHSRLSSLTSRFIQQLREQIPQVRVLTNIPSVSQANKFLGEGQHEDNLLIAGDSHQALSALLPEYTGRIKCIYIDPPYNLGEQYWDYKDTLPKSSKNSIKSENENIQPMSPTNSWLEMMFPRLFLLRQLMREDGVIFVSLDDKEFPFLRIIMDEIFGSANFVCTLIWKKGQGPQKGVNRYGVSINHEYILCYCRGPEFRFRGQPIDISKYKNPDKDPNGPWISTSLTGFANSNERPHLHYEIVSPQSGKRFSPPPFRGWLYNKDKMAELIAANRILWPKTDDGQPHLKRYLSEIKSETTAFSSFLESHSKSSGNRQGARNNQKTHFLSSKPKDLIKTLIQQVTEDDFIVLDAFAGSGVTGQAVLELNSEDGGRRNFILIEANSEIACSLTFDRLSQAIEAQKEKGEIGKGLTFCVLDK